MLRKIHYEKHVFLDGVKLHPRCFIQRQFSNQFQILAAYRQLVRAMWVHMLLLIFTAYGYSQIVTNTDFRHSNPYSRVSKCSRTNSFRLPNARRFTSICAFAQHLLCTERYTNGSEIFMEVRTFLNDDESALLHVCVCVCSVCVRAILCSVCSKKCILSCLLSFFIMIFFEISARPAAPR